MIPPSPIDPHVAFTAAGYFVSEGEELVTVCVEIFSLVFNEVAISVNIATEDDIATSKMTTV